MKRKFNILKHKARVVIRNFKKNKSLKYRVRFMGIACGVGALFIVALVSIASSFGLYESEVKLNLDIKTALYVLKDGLYSFDMNIEGIIPQDAPYTYSFTVNNFDEDKISDVDLTYDIEVVTTTNMPLTYSLYRNEEYQIGTNILTNTSLEQDENGAWYNKFRPNDGYELLKGTKKTDTYTLTVTFPKSYKSTTVYVEQIESIVVNVKSKQKIES